MCPACLAQPRISLPECDILQPPLVNTANYLHCEASLQVYKYRGWLFNLSKSNITLNPVQHTRGLSYLPGKEKRHWFIDTTWKKSVLEGQEEKRVRGAGKYQQISLF